MNPIPNNDDVQSPEREGTYTYRYPHPAVTTDCCIFTFVSGELAILLVRRGLPPYHGVWALPGGFLRINETAEECARRELLEETGYGAERITQFRTYSDVDRDPRERVITIAYYAIVKWGNVVGGDDATEAGWFSLKNLPHLAFDHQRIIADALKVMKRDIYFEPLGYDLLPPEFSMSDLQRVYESIMQTAFDRRNFYNKMRNSGMVIEVEDDDDDDLTIMEETSFNIAHDTLPKSSYFADDIDFSSLDGDDSTNSENKPIIDRLVSVSKAYNESGIETHAYRSDESMPSLSDRVSINYSRLYKLPDSSPERDESERRPKMMSHEDDNESKPKPSRRKNVKYRFNISKFTNLFKKNDEPFKL